MSEDITGVSCPHCGYEFDRAVERGGQGVPAAGDLSMCVRCGGVAVFDLRGDGSLMTRELTQAEWDAIPSDEVEELMEMSANVRAALRSALRKQREIRE